MTAKLIDPALMLGRLALQFGLVKRATRHEDGLTPESDTTHTVMLALIAWQYCPPHLDVGRVLQFCLVHDLVEAKVGDTNTLFLSQKERAAKKEREDAGMRELLAELGDSPVAGALREYEEQKELEARYVRFLDKAVPKLTHSLNECAQLLEREVTPSQLRSEYRAQAASLLREYPEFEGTPTAGLLLGLIDESARAAEKYLPPTSSAWLTKRGWEMGAPEASCWHRCDWCNGDRDGMASVSLAPAYHADDASVFHLTCFRAWRLLVSMSPAPVKGDIGTPPWWHPTLWKSAEFEWARAARDQVAVFLHPQAEQAWLAECGKYDEKAAQAAAAKAAKAAAARAAGREKARAKRELEADVIARYLRKLAEQEAATKATTPE